MQYVQLLRTRPIAVETGKANEQHYEVGTDVLQAMLGPRMKYSACLYRKGGEVLGEVSRDFAFIFFFSLLTLAFRSFGGGRGAFETVDGY